MTGGEMPTGNWYLKNSLGDVRARVFRITDVVGSMPLAMRFSNLL